MLKWLALPSEVCRSEHARPETENAKFVKYIAK